MTESEVISIFAKKEKQWLKLMTLGMSLIAVAAYLFNSQIYIGLGVGIIIVGFIIVFFSTLVIYNCPKCHGIISRGQGVVVWPSKCPKCKIKLR